MNRRFALIVLGMGALLLLVVMVMLSGPQPVLAQCGGQPEQRSSCIACHEVQAPVAGKGEWHSVHAHMDVCVNCHGGNARTLIEADAHSAMFADPLVDIYTDCHSCHPTDYASLANRYAVAAGVTAGSCATPTALPADISQPRPPFTSLVSSSAPGAPATSSNPLSLIAAAIPVLILLFFGMGWLVGRRA